MRVKNANKGSAISAARARRGAGGGCGWVGYGRGCELGGASVRLRFVMARARAGSRACHGGVIVGRCLPSAQPNPANPERDGTSAHASRRFAGHTLREELAECHGHAGSCLAAKIISVETQEADHAAYGTPVMPTPSFSSSLESILVIRCKLISTVHMGSPRRRTSRPFPTPRCE